MNGPNPRISFCARVYLWIDYYWSRLLGKTAYWTDEGALYVEEVIIINRDRRE